MKNEDINKGDAVRHIKTGMIYKAEYFIEKKRYGLGTKTTNTKQTCFSKLQTLSA